MSVTLVVGGCGASAPGATLSNGKTAHAMEIDAMVAVEDLLRDPNSAEWGAIAVRDHGRGRVVVCGMVNARNGYGGYVGERPFLYEAGVAALMTDASAQAFERRFVEACASSSTQPPPAADS